MAPHGTGALWAQGMRQEQGPNIGMTGGKEKLEADLSEPYTGGPLKWNDKRLSNNDFMLFMFAKLIFDSPHFQKNDNFYDKSFEGSFNGEEMRDILDDPKYTPLRKSRKDNMESFGVLYGTTAASLTDAADGKNYETGFPHAPALSAEWVV